ncbi:MAG: fibronectin type III domain-containing protein, partial [Bacteroidota bacterium]
MNIRLLIFLLFTGVVVSLQAQVYPINVTTQVMPPYPSKLSDLSSPILNKLRSSVLLRDARQGNYQVKVKLRIDGPNLTIRSKADYMSPPVQLTFGAPTELSFNDFASLLDPLNLEFQGIDRQGFINEGTQLPEGFYTLCLQTYDYVRGLDEPVSNESCSNFFVTLHDPPIITAPQAQVTPINPQNVLFTWEQLHTGFTANYKLEIYEINQTNSNLAPELVINYSPPFFQMSTGSQRAFLYDPAQIPFQLGGQYIVRVQATDPAGQNGFKNNGYSQLLMFTYGSPCATPTNISSGTVTESTAQVSWSAGQKGGSSAYRVRYKERDNPAANWYEDDVLLLPYTIENLAAGTSYIYEVATVCNGGDSDFLPGGEFTTTDAIFDNTQFECNPSAAVNAPTNRNPIASLAVGDIIKIAGGFEVQIKDLNGDGLYFGEGAVMIPYLKEGLVHVVLDGIRVNTDKVVYEGSIKAKSQGLSSIGKDSLSMTLGTDEICENYTQSNYDQYGFDAAGIHFQTGTEFDPNGFKQDGTHQNGTAFDNNGFDRNGNHKDTGTLYDLNGCDQNGLDRNGQPCINVSTTSMDSNAVAIATDDASALSDAFNAGPATAEGTAFSNGLTDRRLGSDLRRILRKMRDEQQDAVTSLRGDLQEMRDTINQSITRLGFIREFFAGANDEYINEGMSVYFEELSLNGLPSKDPADLARNQEVVRLETEFISLILSDNVLITEWLPRLELLELWLKNEQRRALRDALRKLIEAQPAEKIQSFQQDAANLDTWIEEQLNDLLDKTLFPDDETDDATGFYQPNPNEQLYFPLQLKSERAVYRLAHNAPAIESAVADYLDDFRQMQKRQLENTFQLNNTFAGGTAVHVSTLLSGSGQASKEASDSEIAHASEVVLSMTDYLAKAVQNENVPPENDPKYTPGYGHQLPLKIEKKIAGRDYLIALDSMTFTPTGAAVNAFLSLPVPGKPEEVIAFRAYRVPLTAGGLNTANHKLSLASDVKFNLGPAGSVTLKGDKDKTYIDWDCKGFQSISLDAEVEFCRNHLLPVDAQDKVMEGEEQVTGRFTVQAAEWGQFTAQVADMGRFQIADVPEVIWEPQNIVFDFSDYETPEEVKFPANYTHPNINDQQPDDKKLWKGFYLSALTVKLPKAFKRKSGEALNVIAKDLIIDPSGLTVDLKVENILTIDEGSMDGWAFSLDTFQLALMHTQIEKAGLAGQLILPIDDETKFGYSGMIEPGGRYAFSVRMRDTLDVDMWQAKMNLTENSGIDLWYQDDAFNLVATLNGNIVL